MPIVYFIKLKTLTRYIIIHIVIMMNLIVVLLLSTIRMCYTFRGIPPLNNIVNYESIQFDKMMSDYGNFLNPIESPYRTNNENCVSKSIGPVISLYDLIDVSNCYPNVDLKNLLCDTEVFCIKNNIHLITKDELKYIVAHIIQSKKIS
jgi:hypothetical protein